MMDIQAEKLELIQWLAGINESRIVRQFILLRQANEVTSVLTAAEKKRLMRDYLLLKQVIPKHTMRLLR